MFLVPSYMTELSCPCQVHKASWHMWHYGGKTPKPHYAFANSRHIARLNAGKLKGWAKHKKAMEEHGESHTLVEKYTDSEGRQRWKGTSKLRGSELGPQLFQDFFPYFLWDKHLTVYLDETISTWFWALVISNKDTIVGLLTITRIDMCCFSKYLCF